MVNAETVKETLRERRGEVAIALGIGTLGLTAYLFLLLAGRELGDAAYAPLGALWIFVFLFPPAFLYPVEQELSRAISARRAVGHGIGPVVRRGSQMAGVITVLMVACILLTSPILDEQFFDGDGRLLLAFIAATVSYAIAYVARGIFAGNNNLRAYGVLIAGEGIWRLLGAIVLAIVGVTAAGPYGLLVGLCPFIAVAIASFGKRKSVDPGPPASWAELSTSLGLLIVASLLSQVLVNAAPLLVKYSADASQAAIAGAFAKAVVITRIPLFLFQALQAATLPKLTHFATRGEHASFRSYFRMVMSGVAVIGLGGTIVAFVLGNELLVLFGSEGVLERRDIALLALGNAIFLLALQAAQALVAVKSQARTVVGWAAGLAVFVPLATVGDDILLHVELALVAGAAVSLLVMLWLMLQRLREVEGDPDDFIETVTHSHEFT